MIGLLVMFRILTTHVLTLVTLALVAGVVGAAELRHVPEDYPTISAAYAAAQPGDTIEVNRDLSLEPGGPPVAFDRGIPVTFRTARSRAIVTSTNPPPNDTFFGRLVLGGATPSVAVFNYSAAPAHEDGFPPPRSVQNTLGGFGRSLWFEWVPPGDGLAIINSVGSDFDTLLDVFTNSPPAAGPSVGLWSLFNEVGLNAVAGVTNYILVGGVNAAYGEVRLNITLVSAPPNDDFDRAHRLDGITATVEGTTFGATRELPGEPEHGGMAADHSVWFHWTAPVTSYGTNRPVTFSTAGSDFDTLLVVYQGVAFSNLVLVAANDDRTSGVLDSEVSFRPVAGETYRIAIDGSRKWNRRRFEAGNYLLRLDHSTVNIEVPAASVRRETLADRRVQFSADVATRNWGDATTGPLRLRIAARSGSDFPGIQRAPAAGETNLTVVSLTASGLVPNASLLRTVSGVCPAPFATAARTNIWGVFVVLEEWFAGEWVPIDRNFLLYGDVPETGEPVLTYGVGRPVPPALTINETNQVQGVGLRLSNYATDMSSNLFSLIAQFYVGGERTISNFVMTVPSWVTNGISPVRLHANGVLLVGDLPASTNFTITSKHSFAGVRQQNGYDTVKVYRRPTFAILPDGNRQGLTYVLRSDFPANYAVEFSEQLGIPSSWQPFTNIALSRFPYTNVINVSTNSQRVFRIQALP